MRRLAQQLRRTWQLARLRQSPSRLATVLAQSLRATAAGTLTPEARHLLDRIEARRTALNASTAVITIPDYGAGHPSTAHQPGAMVTHRLGPLSQRNSKRAPWCQLLFHLVRTMRPACGLELGTAVGVSGAYQAVALELNGQGQLLTLEGAPALAAIAQETFQALGLTRVQVVVGPFQETLPRALAASPPMEYVFLDGHHEAQAVLGYVDQLLPALAAPALLVIDDITWSTGMRRAWQQLAQDPRFGLTVDLGPLGVCIRDQTLRVRRTVRLPWRPA